LVPDNLALEDLQIKSKFPRSNMPIHEVGRSGERKNPRGRRKKMKKPRTERLGAGLKHHLDAVPDANNHGARFGANNHGAKLDAKIYAVELGAKIYGAKVPAKSPLRLCRAQDIGVKIYDAETCKLGATNDNADLNVQILKTYLQRAYL